MSLVFFIIAAVGAAAGDRLLKDRYSDSIFGSLNPRFWNMEVSRKYLKTFAGYPVDAWFCVQAVKIIMVSLSIVSYSPITVPAVDLFLYAGVWAFVYDVFFCTILKKRG
jgi:hypothetical protein